MMFRHDVNISFRCLQVLVQAIDVKLVQENHTVNALITSNSWLTI